MPVERSTLRLSEVARHVVMPRGIVHTLWFDVEERCAEFGDQFDVWQDGLGQLALGLRADGMFAATVGGITLSIPRQVAKTFIVGRIVVALCTLYPDLTVLWTAHRTRTAGMTFQKLKGFVTRKSVRPYLEPGRNLGTAIRDTNGEQEIPFANGSRIMFGAREQGFGRGFDEVDIEVFDEAQILTEKALEDMVAATNQSRFEHGALLFYMGTPPRPTDPGEVFAARRAEALEAKAGRPDFGEPVAAGDALYVECSADPNIGQKGGPSLDDPKQVEKANPSYPHRTPPISVARLRKNLPSDEAWRREGLGVWDVGVGPQATIKRATWDALQVLDAPDAAPAFGVKYSLDGERVSLAVAVMDGDVVHVEVIGQSTAQGARFGGVPLAEWLAGAWRGSRGIGVDGKAVAGALEAELRDKKIPARMACRFTPEQAVTAHAQILDAVESGRLTHIGQPELTAAVLSATKRKIGTAGGWGWQAIGDGDVLDLEAATVAVGMAMQAKQRVLSGAGRGGVL